MPRWLQVVLEIALIFAIGFAIYKAVNAGALDGISSVMSKFKEFISDRLSF